MKSFKQSERIQDSLIKHFLVRNKIFMSDFMVVTKSLIAMHPDVLTSSFYIHLKAENLLYLKNKIMKFESLHMEKLTTKIRSNLKSKINILNVIIYNPVIQFMQFWAY